MIISVLRGMWVLIEGEELLLVTALMVRSSISICTAALILFGGSWAASAATMIIDQGPADPMLQSRNSNTPTNSGSDQQVADDFVVLGSGLEVNRVELWFTYRDLVTDQVAGEPPALQTLLVRIFGDNEGDPGLAVYEATVSFVPVPTETQNGFLSPNDIFYASIDLADPFQPVEDERYWLSPLGVNDEVTWQWQLSSPEGERRSRGGAGGPDWRSTALDNVTPLAGNFAFRMHIVPEPSGGLMLGSVVFVLGGRRSRTRRA